MDTEMQDCKPAAAPHHILIAIPGDDQRGNKVVPVEEDELLFLENNEHSVTLGWGRGASLGKTTAVAQVFM